AAELDHVSIDGDVEGRLDGGKVPAPVGKHDEGVREGVPEGRARQNRRRKPLTENEFGVGKKSMSSHEVAVLPGRMGDIKGSTVRCPGLAPRPGAPCRTDRELPPSRRPRRGPSWRDRPDGRHSPGDDRAPKGSILDRALPGCTVP